MHQDESIQHIERTGDRRQGESASLLLHIKELQATAKALEAKMTYHHAIFRDEVEKSVERVYVSAFPDGDPAGHRRHHELVIKREEEKVIFWTTLRTKLAEWGLIAFAGWALYALWAAFLQGPKK
jgi:hypothetical protein